MTVFGFIGGLSVVCLAAGTGTAEDSQVAVGINETGLCGRGVRDGSKTGVGLAL